MNVLWWIFVAIVWIVIAFWPARVAGRKGHSFIGYFIFSLFFFPAAMRRRLPRPRSHLRPTQGCGCPLTAVTGTDNRS